MSDRPSQITALASLREAKGADASPEALHAIMLEVAADLAAAGYAQSAANIRRTAATLEPMFGMRQQRSRRWWQR